MFENADFKPFFDLCHFSKSLGKGLTPTYEAKIYSHIAQQNYVSQKIILDIEMETGKPLRPACYHNQQTPKKKRNEYKLIQVY